MNNSTAIFLINQNTRAIQATYEAGDKAPVELFKTLDASVQVGDLVLVETDTRHKMTVCKVSAVDVDFDIETPANVRWIISRIDASEYERLKGLEEGALAAIKSAELRRKREQLAAALVADANAKEIESLRAEGAPAALTDGSGA